MIYLVFFIIAIIIVILMYAKHLAFKKIFLKRRRNKQDIINDLSNRDKFEFSDWEDILFDEVSIKSKEGFNLKGYLNKCDSEKFIIIQHGYSANHFVCYQFIEPFLKENYNILLVDMRNHGDSEGENISYGYYEVDDLDRWVDYLRERFGEGISVGLHGQSMGAAIVLMYGGRNSRKIKYVIADCSYSSAKNVIRYQLVKVNKLPFQPLFSMINKKCKRMYGFDLEDVNPIEEIKGCDVPILFIHGIGDTLIPYSHSVDMYDSRDNSDDRIFLAKGAEHVGSCSSSRDVYNKVIMEFIENKI